MQSYFRQPQPDWNEKLFNPILLSMNQKRRTSNYTHNVRMRRDWMTKTDGLKKESFLSWSTVFDRREWKKKSFKEFSFSSFLRSLSVLLFWIDLPGFVRTYVRTYIQHGRIQRKEITGDDDDNGGGGCGGLQKTLKEEGRMYTRTWTTYGS